MKSLLCLLLLCVLFVSGCATALTAERNDHDVEATIAVVTADLSARQSGPQLPDSFRESLVEGEMPAVARQDAGSEDDMRPLAYLICPDDFVCPACEQWWSRREELPFRLKKKIQHTSPSGAFPVLWHPDEESPTGWRYWTKGFDDFLKHWAERSKPVKALPAPQYRRTA